MVLTLLCTCLILAGCFSLLKGKKQKNPELTGYIDSELAKFFDRLDEESETLIINNASESN